MSARISPFTNKAYGQRRICSVFGISRATVARHLCKRAEARLKRGPKPVIDDMAMVAAIRSDLASSHFKGEGHRKVHARLRRRGLVVGRQRVLNLMRAEHLLSPHRRAMIPKREHDGQITTDGPDKMWATDATKVYTRRNGWVWVFPVVEHWNGECLAIHVAKHGSRFAALSPLCTALKQRFGKVERGVAEASA